MVDERLAALADRAPAEKAAHLRSLAGRAAVANTRLVYAAFTEITASDRWKALKAKGAPVQRPLWGSTGTKNKAYSDLIYVESLIGQDTVNTVPPATYAAILSHGKAAPSIASGVAEGAALIGQLQAEGIFIDDILEALERDGVASFERSFDGLSRNVDKKRKAS
jgi:transaldolase